MSKSQRLIVFFIPQDKIINGGVLSIFSLCRESRALKAIHKADVVLCTLPGYPSYKKNDLFENDELIYSFDQIAKQGPIEYLQLHVPEYAANEAYMALRKKYSAYLASVGELSVNIMNQNIKFMPQPADIAKWFSLTPTVTQSTAHDRYCNQETANLYAIPTHLMSVFNDPKQYTVVPFEKKKDRIVLSPDETDRKKAVVEAITKQFPTYEIITIQDMTYEVYKKTMRDAKFAVTFGEGFDGYFIEAFFSGGMTFAVYNDDFFPSKDFAKFGNTYKSYDEMVKHVAKDMAALAQDKAAYDKIVQQNLKKIVEFYDFSAYQANLKKFYRKQFTYLPEPGSDKQLFMRLVEAHAADAEALVEKDQAIAELRGVVAARDNEIAEKAKLIQTIDQLAQEREAVITDMVNSISWRLTQPLRSARASLKRNQP